MKIFRIRTTRSERNEYMQEITLDENNTYYANFADAKKHFSQARKHYKSEDAVRYAEEQYLKGLFANSWKTEIDKEGDGGIVTLRTTMSEIDVVE